MDAETQLRNENAHLKALLSKMSLKKENFYQQILERRYHAVHFKTSAGITDLTNEAFHGEIKNWETHSNSIGQIMLYNIASPRPSLKVFVFGIRPRQIKMQNILELHEKTNIDLIELDIDGSTTSSQHNIIASLVDLHVIKTNNNKDRVKISTIFKVFQSKNNDIDLNSKTQSKQLITALNNKGFIVNKLRPTPDSNATKCVIMAKLIEN